MTALGYVKQTFKQDGTWYPVAVCSLTDLGKTALSLMEVSEPELMQKYAFEYSKRSLRDILDEVHEKSNLGQVEIGVVILEPQRWKNNIIPKLAQRVQKGALHMKYYLTRGKRLDTGEWIYGVLLQKPDGSLYIVMNQKNYAVDPDTVGRYTGLRDRMNAQIFHDDILHVVIPSGSKDSFDDYDVGYVVLHNDKYRLPDGSDEPAPTAAS